MRRISKAGIGAVTLFAATVGFASPALASPATASHVVASKSAAASVDAAALKGYYTVTGQGPAGAYTSVMRIYAVSIEGGDALGQLDLSRAALASLSGWTPSFVDWYFGRYGANGLVSVQVDLHPDRSGNTFRFGIGTFGAFGSGGGDIANGTATANPNATIAATYTATNANYDQGTFAATRTGF